MAAGAVEAAVAAADRCRGPCVSRSSCGRSVQSDPADGLPFLVRADFNVPLEHGEESLPGALLDTPEMAPDAPVRS